MENLTYASRLCFLDAEDVTDPVVDYDGLQVDGREGEKIGDVDGFIIDRQAQRVNYIVVDSGGWFTSRRLLLPIGHAVLTPDRKALVTDVSRDAVSRLPEFDEDRFPAFSDEELRAFERNTVVACCPDEPLEDVSIPVWGYDSRRHYQQPEWWHTARYAQDRLRTLKRGVYRSEQAAALAASLPPPVMATSPAASSEPGRIPATTIEPSAGHDSPHVDRRAQPGDVLGIETAGERAQPGDLAGDEDSRRG